MKPERLLQQVLLDFVGADGFCGAGAAWGG